MKVEFDSSFEKQILKLTDSSIKKRIVDIIYQVEKSIKLSDIHHIKKMKGFKNFYRIKSGDYRLGFELINNDTIYFIAFAHRKDIYKKFP